MKVSVYRVSYHTVTKRDGAEIRRTSPVEMRIAGPDLGTALLALPQPNQDEGTVTENVLISSHILQHDVPLGEKPASKKPKVAAPRPPAA